jgi:hypothetical protein
MKLHGYVHRTLDDLGDPSHFGDMGIAPENPAVIKGAGARTGCPSFLLFAISMHQSQLRRPRCRRFIRQRSVLLYRLTGLEHRLEPRAQERDLVWMPDRELKDRTDDQVGQIDEFVEIMLLWSFHRRRPPLTSRRDSFGVKLRARAIFNLDMTSL